MSAPWGTIARSTIWPYSNGEEGEFAYSRNAHPTGVEARRHSEGSTRACAPVRIRGGGRDRGGARSAPPGQTVAMAKGAYYGIELLFRDLEHWGVRSVEFDQTDPAARRRPDLARGAFEFRSSRFPTSPQRPRIRRPCSSMPRPRRPCSSGHTSTVPTSFFTARRSTSGAITTSCSGRSYANARRITTACFAPHTHRRDRGARRRVAPPAQLGTLELRVRRQAESALELARRLAEHPAVERIRYPGLEPDPPRGAIHEGGFGGLVSFDVRGDARAVERSTDLIANATSLGGVSSTLESRRRWEGTRVPEGLIRLSVGIEDVEKLWADLERALAAA